MDNISLINSYVDEYFVDGQFIEQVKNLKNLTRYMFNNEISSSDIDIDSYIKLISNEKINNMIKCILSRKEYGAYRSNELFESLLIAYCSVNNLDLDSFVDNEKEYANFDEEIDTFINNMKEASPVKIYLKEISRYKLLTPEETRDLFIRYENATGQEKNAVREIICVHNLRLVPNVAKRYIGRGVAFADLIQDGNLGLLKSIDRYDYRKGFRFSTYSNCWIKQMIIRSIADNSRTVRFPVQIHELVNKINAFVSSYFAKYGENPTYEMIAIEMGIERKKVEEVLNIQNIMSLDEPVKSTKDEDSATFGDFALADEYTEEKLVDKLLFEDLVNEINHMKLSSREKIIFFERSCFNDLGEKVKWNDFGKEFNITGERARQIYNNVLKKISNHLKIKGYKASDFNLVIDNSDKQTTLDVNSKRDIIAKINAKERLLKR